MKEMSIIHFLVRLHVIIAVVGHPDHLLRAAHRLDAVPDDAEDDGESPVESQEMTVLQDGADWIDRHGGVEEGGEGGGGGLEGQQEVQRGGADETALRCWRSEQLVRYYHSDVLPDTVEPVWTSRHVRTAQMPGHGRGGWGRCRYRTV